MQVLKKSWGLFHKAAIESGAFNTWTQKSMAHAQDTYDAFLCDIKCNSSNATKELACLLATESDTLLADSDSTYGFGTTVYAPLPHGDNAFSCLWTPPVDGVELQDTPLALLQRGEVAPNVSVILGTNRDEGTYFTTTQRPTNATWQESGLAKKSTGDPL